MIVCDDITFDTTTTQARSISETNQQKHLHRTDSLVVERACLCSATHFSFQAQTFGTEMNIASVTRVRRRLGLATERAGRRRDALAEQRAFAGAVRPAAAHLDAKPAHCGAQQSQAQRAKERRRARDLAAAPRRARCGRRAGRRRRQCRQAAPCDSAC